MNTQRTNPRQFFVSSGRFNSNLPRLCLEYPLTADKLLGIPDILDPRRVRRTPVTENKALPQTISTEDTIVFSRVSGLRRPVTRVNRQEQEHGMPTELRPECGHRPNHQQNRMPMLIRMPVDRGERHHDAPVIAFSRRRSTSIRGKEDRTEQQRARVTIPAAAPGMHERIQCHNSAPAQRIQR